MGILVNQFYSGDFICKFTNCKFRLYNDSYDCTSYVIDELNPLVIFRISNNINHNVAIHNFNERKEELLSEIKSINKLTNFWLRTLEFKEEL